MSAKKLYYKETITIYKSTFYICITGIQKRFMLL